MYTVDFIYTIMFFGLICRSIFLTNRDEKFKGFFYGASTVYGLLTFIVIGVLISDVINGLFLNKDKCKHSII
jgi:cytochrome bd-type quinol oxidase subunit 2